MKVRYCSGDCRDVRLEQAPLEDCDAISAPKSGVHFGQPPVHMHQQYKFQPLEWAQSSPVVRYLSTFDLRFRWLSQSLLGYGTAYSLAFL
jgi:hypothetical protein